MYVIFPSKICLPFDRSLYVNGHFALGRTRNATPARVCVGGNLLLPPGGYVGGGAGLEKGVGPGPRAPAGNPRPRPASVGGGAALGRTPVGAADRPYHPKFR